MDKFKIVLSATGYKPTNGQLEQDADGYYKVIMGAFNIFNSAGAFYLEKGVRDIIENPNSIFKRRVDKGCLYGEMGHPTMKPGMSIQEFMQRNGRMDPQNQAFHVRKVWMVETDEKTEKMGTYGNIVLVYAWVKPCGPKGAFLKESLDNPHVNTAFSIRCISKDTMVNGVCVKETKAILGWDWVDEPGIHLANKFDTVNRQKFNTESFDMGGLELSESDISTFTSVVEDDIANGYVSQEAADTLSDMAGAIKEIFLPTGRNKMLSW